MRENIELFSQMLARLKFIEPAPLEVQRHIRKIKRDQFNKILKRTGNYSLIFALITNLFFFLKKAGINITIVKSAAVLAVSSSIAVTAIGIGAYHAAKILIQKPEIRIEQKIEDREESKDKIINSIKTEKIKEKANPETGEKKAKTGFIERGIGIQRFSALNIETSIADKVTDAVADELGRLRGRDYIIDFREASNTKTGMILRGSVEFLDGAYKITAKIIDVATLKILFYTAESVDSQDKLNNACRNIARKITESSVFLDKSK